MKFDNEEVSIERKRVTKSEEEENKVIEKDGDTGREVEKGDAYDPTDYKIQPVLRSSLLLLWIHTMAIYGAWIILTGQMYFNTFAWAVLHGWACCIGVTAGAHRLWAHKAYKARLPLKILLMWWDTIAVQNSIFEWCRDHRVHHKFTETHADPRNAKRGFFFAHMGWLMVRKHPDVIRKGATVDMSDLAKDPVVMFQHRHYSALVTIFAFGIPTVIPYFFGPGETLWVCWLSTCFRYVLSLHLTWLVNSAAHLWGPRPYDKGLNPSENMAVSILTGGEGWHNFHHVYPQDYKASELGLYAFSPATAFIDLFATLGLAYDLKTIPKRVIELRMQRTGDGSQYRH